MSYQQYGIRPELVGRVKMKLKNPAVKDRIKGLVHGITKADLQDRPKVKRMVKSAAVILNEPIADAETEQIVSFIVGQRIDPNNTFHLLKLWGMFR
ncbi:MAG TPA: stage VI sporulation protein F [Paenibacillus sp.]|uniref:stage VI sporulation protein F n=1 Tax=Paenibacillus sp. TaxID=58172 RepID=UPI0028D548BE|nr:stage VI sporulation protein F [Paenibacillus sp.]HUC93421.1 stage VI sporulation protein F [Paenibacillus sp.]